jgi:peptide/nickel transport system substrate-binding protein
VRPVGEIGLNLARLGDDAIDQSLHDERGRLDLPSRRADYATLQRRLGELVPYVWLRHTSWSVAARPSVHAVANGELPDHRPAQPMQNGVHRLTQTWVGDGVAS